MFVAGVVGAVGVAVIAHNDHSNWQEHKQYSDAEVVADIENEKARLQRDEKDLSRMRKQFWEDIQDRAEAVASHEEVAAALQKIGCNSATTVVNEAMIGSDYIPKQIKEQMVSFVQEEIQQDQQTLDKINAAILQINNYKLK